MKIKFLQDNAGIKKGEELTILELRQRVEWASNFNDDQLKSVFLSSKIGAEVNDIEPELRTAVAKTPRKHRVTR